MDHRCKIVLSNSSLYKEIELSPEMKTILVGTGIECEARLHRELFFSPIRLQFEKNHEGTWYCVCSDNLYLSDEGKYDVSKPIRQMLKHGDIFQVKYRESDSAAFTVEFLIDFNTGDRRYERVIDLGQASTVEIGTANSGQIILAGGYVRNDGVILRRQRDGFLLEVVSSSFGVYHNGQKITDTVQLVGMDFFSLSDYFFYIRGNCLYTEIRPDMTIQGLQYTDNPFSSSYPRFNRSTRVQEPLNEEPIEVLDPPQKPQKPKSNLITRLLPAMGMLLAAGVMAYFGGMMIIMSAISGTMAVVTTIITYRESKKDYREGTEKRIKTYTQYIDNKRIEIQEVREAERETLERIYLPPAREMEYFDDFSPLLFDRDPRNKDFLCVRLGTGDVEAARIVDYKKQERLEIEDELQLLPQRLHDEYRFIHEAPVVCDLKKASAIGVVGAEACRFALLKNIMIDIAARQYYSDVRFAFVCQPEHAEKIRWLRFLPQVTDPNTGLRLIVTDNESKTVVYETLYKELAAREQRKSFDCRLVVFFYDEFGLKSHPISKFVEKASDLGVTFIFFGNVATDIPLGCSAIIESSELGKGVLIDTSGAEEKKNFRYIETDDSSARKIVRLLAPVYTEELSLDGGLTRNISLFQLLNIFSVDDLNLGDRWNSTQASKSMAAPIGVSKSSVISLDLHDKAHGPHGLVAGTTGSGKSEILQTYILSMATLYSPDEVGFVIIDFKGGGMANQFRKLPHLLGTITNIDGKEIDRSLKSIKAELQTRQRLFAEADVNHIDSYIRKYRTGEVATPLPHLIVIVDEFAELKAEQPEFMKELISAARIGRSLGVHLILATQKPAGQVNEQIWSNSRFKLCLKVQSQEDSNEVLKSPLAAEIKEPGRAYLQVGNNEIFELFQSAYSGALESAFDDSVKEFSIYSVSDVGKRTVIFSQKKRKADDNARTQLQAIVDYVAAYCEKNGVRKLSNIFLPPLSAVVDFPETDGASVAYPVTCVDIGIFDDPENQAQEVYSLDIENQNLMIIGSAQSGKTNLLQTMIRSITVRYTPEQVSIYIIDFASMTLKNYEDLKHVGGVITPAEDEKLRNLLKMLFSEIEKRKQRMLEVGVSSFSAYREAGRTDLPHIVVMIDNLTALKEMYFQDDAELLRLCREGLSVGVTMIVANGQTSGIGYKYLTNFSARIAMFCNDPSEYSALFNHCRERVEEIRGRCLIEVDKRFLDCQTYLAFHGEKEYERLEKICRFIETTNARVSGRAQEIPEIPQLLTQDYVVEHFADQMKDSFSLVIGLDYANVSPLALKLNGQSLLAVSGRAHSGKTTFICNIVTMLERMYPEQSEVYIVDSIAHRLESLKNKANVKSYSILADRAIDTVKSVEMQLKERYDALASGNERVLSESKLLLVILNSVEAAEAVSGNPTALEAFRNILGRYRSLNAFILLGNYENAAVSYSAPEVIKKAKDLKHFVFFDDLSSMKITDIPILTQRAFKKPIERGDCYYIRENECMKLKTTQFTL